MAAGRNGVHIVLCPGCRRPLLEPPDVEIYKCGGCEKILRAKNRSPPSSDPQGTPVNSSEVCTTSTATDGRGSPESDSQGTKDPPPEVPKVVEEIADVRPEKRSPEMPTKVGLETKILRAVDELRDDLHELLSSDESAPRRRIAGRRVASQPDLPSSLRPRLPPALLSRSTADALPEFLYSPPEQNTAPPARPRPATATAAKKHCLPILLGAPFIICSSCSVLLQLPADIAVARNRLRRLRCGRCSELLLYSYRQPRREISPPEEDEPASVSGEPLNVSRSSSFAGDGDGEERRARLHMLLGYPSARMLLVRNPSGSVEASGEWDRKGKAVVADAVVSDEPECSASAAGRVRMI